MPYCVGIRSSASFAGCKGNQKTLGLTDGAPCCSCYSLKKEQMSISAFRHAVAAGLSTGFVTTTRVTHATPAATYANTQFRDWEYNV